MNDNSLINKEKKARYMKAWRANNRERAREISREASIAYSRAHPVERHQSIQKLSDNRRKFIFDFFGNKCVTCGFTDERALQLDHINGGGPEHRKQGWSLQHRYKFVKEQPAQARATLQLLCANCNWIKRVEHKEYRKPKS